MATVDITGVVLASLIGSVLSRAEHQLGLVLEAFSGGVAAAIVCGDDNQRVAGNACFFHGFHHLTNGPVRLHDKVPVGPERAFALEIFRGNDRCVRAGQGHVEEERFFSLCLLLDISRGLFGEHGKHIHGFEVGMSRAHAEEFFLGGAFADKTLVLNPDVGWHVERGGDAVVVVKADGIGPVFDLPLPVGVFGNGTQTIRRGEVHAKVPFAEHAGGVAVLLQHGGNGLPAGFNHGRGETAENTCLLFAAPVVTPGEHTVTGGSAHCRRAVRIGELHTGLSQAIHVRRVDLTTITAVGFHIPESPVVCEDEDDVGGLY